MVSNEAKYVEQQNSSLEMQLFLAENPEMVNAATMAPGGSRSPNRQLSFQDQVYNKTSVEAANKMLLPR